MQCPQLFELQGPLSSSSATTLLDKSDNDDGTMIADCSRGPSRPTSIKHASYLSDLSAASWLWEILSWIVSSCSVFAIFIILMHYDGRPLPEWPFKITLNTLLAVFSTVAKAALMIPVVEGISQLKWLWFAKKSRRLIDFEAFDKASRGPWGSFQLLKTVHLWYVAFYVTIMRTRERLGSVRSCIPDLGQRSKVASRNKAFLAYVSTVGI